MRFGDTKCKKPPAEAGGEGENGEFPVLTSTSAPHNFGKLPKGTYLADEQGEAVPVSEVEAEACDYIYTYGGLPLRFGWPR